MNWKKALRKKLKKKGGFTLIEMLIVVAIIAILVAVSIPLVTSSLDKARKATDAANERAAKAAAVIEYMTNGKDDTYYYDAAEGNLKSTTGAGTISGYGQCSVHKGDYLIVEIEENGSTKVYWHSKGEDGALDSDGLMTTTPAPSPSI